MTILLVFRSLETGEDVTFEEFVQYVLQQADVGQDRLDSHWRPQYNLCQPCHINYDFIGHYETLRQDAEHMFCDRYLATVITQTSSFQPQVSTVETETRRNLCRNSTAKFQRVSSFVYCICTREIMTFSASNFRT